MRDFFIGVLQKIYILPEIKEKILSYKNRGDIIVKYTVMDFARQLMYFKDEHNINLQDGMTHQECYDMIVSELGAQSKDQLKQLAKNNLQVIENNFSFKGLRIWAYSYFKQDLLKSFTGPDMLECKYDKLLEDINEFHSNLLDFKWQIEFFVYQKMLEEVWKEEYGNLKADSPNLYSLMKVLKLGNFKKSLIDELYDILNFELKWNGDKYYVRKDLHDPKTLKMLYLHIMEENFDETEVKGVGLFDYDDGYGNRIYYDTFRDENDKVHISLKEKNSTINDFYMEW